MLRKNASKGRPLRRVELGHLVSGKNEVNQIGSKTCQLQAWIGHYPKLQPQLPSRLSCPPGLAGRVSPWADRSPKSSAGGCSDNAIDACKSAFAQPAHLPPCLIFSNSLCNSAARTLCRITFPPGPISIMVGNVCTPKALASRLPSRPPDSKSCSQGT